MTAIESEYAQIEKELLPIVFAVERFDTYVYSRKITIETDHKPLETIFKKSLQSSPRRLQKMLLCLQKYDINIVYKRGTELYLADTLSRAFLQDTGEKRSVEQGIESICMLEYLSVSEETRNQIKEAMKSDPTMLSLLETVKTGWPEDKNTLPSGVQQYYNFREELTTQSGFLFRGNRLIIIYWPGMYKEVEDYVKCCSVCNKYKPDQQKEPLVSFEVPEQPWEILGCDLFELDKKHYIICVDYFSDFYEVDKLEGLEGGNIITKLKSYMYIARYGIPKKLVSDNGPPFNSEEFAKFSKDYGFQHVTSSSRYPQANGKSENAVKLAKQLLIKCKEDGTD